MTDSIERAAVERAFAKILDGTLDNYARLLLSDVLDSLRALPPSPPAEDGEVEDLRTAIKAILAAVNPSDRSGISLFVWNERLKAATVIGEQALANTKPAPLPEPPKDS